MWLSRERLGVLGELSQRLYTSLWPRTKLPGSQEPRGNTLLSQLRRESSAASECSASTEDQVEHLGHHRWLSSKVKWDPQPLVQAGLSSSKKGFGAPPRAGFMRNVPSESGRTIPHLTAISQHVAKRCHARQPLITGEHPKNPLRLSQHTEHQNCFISASFHTGGSFLTLFSFYVYAMSKYSYNFSFI